MTKIEIKFKTCDTIKFVIEDNDKTCVLECYDDQDKTAAIQNWVDVSLQEGQTKENSIKEFKNYNISGVEGLLDCSKYIVQKRYTNIDEDDIDINEEEHYYEEEIDYDHKLSKEIEQQVVDKCFDHFTQWDFDHCWSNAEESK